MAGGDHVRHPVRHEAGDPVDLGGRHADAVELVRVGEAAAWGHLAVGRAAEAVGIQQMVPVAASYPLEEVATASSVAAVFQMTFVGDEDAVVDMMHRPRWPATTTSASPTHRSGNDANG